MKGYIMKCVDRYIWGDIYEVWETPIDERPRYEIIKHNKKFFYVKRSKNKIERLSVKQFKQEYIIINGE